MGVGKRSKEGLKIDSATIGMESARSYRASNVTVRRFAITEYQAGLTQNNNTLNTAVNDSQEDVKEKESQATEKKANMLDDWQNRYGMASSRVKLRESIDNAVEDIRQVTLRYIFDLLFSARRERLSNWLDEGSRTEGVSENNAETTQNAQAANGGGTFMTSFKVLNYVEESFSIEEENTAFSTVGTVRTADGRELQFNVEVGMSREFQQYYREELELASFTMCDPLVINLNTNVAELSDQKFFFDIDADGEEDEISQLGAGSGYLALDQNNDGIINDGSELFGTSSGDGFADLEKYDEDGNGWIDENDAVWSKLKIWCKDENGQDVLYRLAEKGVGAICLQRAATDFTLQGGTGQTHGAIRSTGIFLYENGSAGTVQHVDVAKYSKEA